jgi:signal transduction histidine kinase
LVFGDGTRVIESSVQRRIWVRLIPLLALLFAAGVFWIGRDLERTVLAAHLESARASSRTAVVAIEASMLAEGRHRPWDAVARMIPDDEGSTIEIVAPAGRVVFSASPGRRGQLHRVEEPLCSACHLPGGEAVREAPTVVRTEQGGGELVLASALLNAERCWSCHDPQERKLGTVLVRRPMGPVRSRVRGLQVGIALVAGITLLGTMLATRLLLGRYLGRPLGKLVAGAREIGAGNLSYRIALEERSELALLASTLNRSTERLAKLQDELVQQERLAAVGEAVAGLAHCLKNLLNGLRAGQYVIDRAVEKKDEATLRKGWTVMKRAVGQVEKLTADMLYYVKRREPERQPTDPNAIVGEVVSLLEEQAASAGVEIRTDLDSSIAEAQLDRTLIYRALLNLVANAIDACAESETGDRIVVSSHDDVDEIVLGVADNGVGMSQEVLSSLFQRFFSTKAGRGTGLGLSVVNKIAREHGGSVQVESEQGRGSRFELRLPRNASLEPEDAAEGSVRIRRTDS